LSRKYEELVEMVEQLQSYDDILATRNTYRQTFLDGVTLRRAQLLNRFKLLANATT